MGFRRIFLAGLLVMLLLTPAVAQQATGDFYNYRGWCGLAYASVNLLGYGQTVELGSIISGRPDGAVIQFLGWCAEYMYWGGI